MPELQTWNLELEDGDLTELSESESEEESHPPAPPPPPTQAFVETRFKATRPSTQKATQKSKERGGLKPKTRGLNPFRPCNFAAASIFDWIEQDTVDLNPEYQRGVVWNEAKQMGLIDSLINNYYIPPIVFAYSRDEDGTETRICIDGKQRLTSIHRFMKGEIAYKDPQSNRKLYFTSPSGGKRKLIPVPMHQNFRNKQITCVEYDGITKEQEREIFQRVQLGVTLAPADRLPAINGPYADLVRGLRTKIDTTPGFEHYLEWGKARGKDFQALAQIVYLIENRTRKTEPTSTRLESFLNTQGVDLAPLRETMNNVLDIFCRIVQHPELSLPLQKNLSPLEFVFSAYLIYLHRRQLTDTQLSDAIQHMRNDLKYSTTESSKSNTANFKRLFAFLQKSLAKIIPKLCRGPVGEKIASEVPHQIQVADMKANEEAVNARPNMKRKRLGKRELEKEDSDSEYTTPPKKKTLIKGDKSVIPKAETKPQYSPLLLLGRSALTNKAKTSVKKTSPSKPRLHVESTSAGKVEPIRGTNKSEVAYQFPRISDAANSKSTDNAYVETNNVGITAISSTSNNVLNAVPVSEGFESTLARCLSSSSSLSLEPADNVDESVAGLEHDRLAPLRQAKLALMNSSSSSVGLTDNSTRGAAPRQRSKYPNNLKFNKKNSTDFNEVRSTSADDEHARWSADCHSLFNSNPRQSVSTPNPRSTPMVSTQALTPTGPSGSESILHRPLLTPIDTPPTLNAVFTIQPTLDPRLPRPNLPAHSAPAGASQRNQFRHM